MKKLTGIILGILLICCGVIYSLTAFDVINFTFSLDGWWTLFIIIPCLSGLFTTKDKLGNLIGLSVGVLLLLAARDILDYSMIWKIIVPLIVVLIGVKMIAKSVSSKDGEDNLVGSDKKEIMGVFNEQNADYGDGEFTGAKVGAVFGGTHCNLANAKIANGSQIDLICVFGGADIALPENVTVTNNSFCLFGGIDDKRAKKTADGDTVNVTINGFCLFGGADIK